MDYGRRCDDLAKGESLPQSARAQGGSRRLTQKLLSVAHLACDQGEEEVARSLLALAETLMRQRGEFQGVSGRKTLEQLVLAHERVWRMETRPVQGRSAHEEGERFADLKNFLWDR